MKKLLLTFLLGLPLLLHGAAYDVVLQQRNAGNTSFTNVTLSPQANSLLSFGANKAAGTTLISAFDPAGAAAAVTPITLGLVIDTNVQRYNANLTGWAGGAPSAPPAIGGTTPAAGKFTTLESTGVNTFPGAKIITAATMPALAIDGTKMSNTKTLTISSTLTVSGSPATDQYFGAWLTNSDLANAVTVTHTGGNPALFTIPAGLTNYYLWHTNGAGVYDMIGGSPNVVNLEADATPAGTELVETINPTTAKSYKSTITQILVNNQGLTINPQTASYVLTLADQNAIITMNVTGTANTVTVPPHSSVAFKDGVPIYVEQLGTGATSIVAGSGVTINQISSSLTLPGQNTYAQLIPKATDTWDLLLGPVTQVAGANPSVAAILTAVNGSAPTFMRSDSAPAISQAIVPTWSGIHTWNNATDASSTSTGSIITAGGIGAAKKLYVGTDAHVLGIHYAGSGPTTLTDATGKVLSAALNTVAVANGGTAATTAAAATVNLTPAPVNLGNLTGTINIDWATGQMFYGVLTGSTTFTFSNAATSAGWIFVRVSQTGTNTYTVTWPSMNWIAATAPTMTAGSAAHDDTSVVYMNSVYDANSVQNLH
jgi:hypothetical protein